MRDQDAGVVPVIENEQSRQVVGVVTDRDLCMNVVAEGRDPRTTQIHECMTAVVVSASPQDSVDIKTTETHETLKTVSAPSREPSKPRAKSRRAA